MRLILAIIAVILALLLSGCDYSGGRLYLYENAPP